MFARAPIPGQVKTRLVPRLGAWRAARLHARLTRHAVATALAARCGPVEVHGTARHSFFSSLPVGFGLQRGDDLGERMARALDQAFCRNSFAILIGTDCPILTPADLRRAARSLRGGCEVVLAPAEDGGYALIGLSRMKKELFANIAWGGPQVYADTVKKLAGCRWRALRTVWDVDRPEDLPRLSRLRLRWLRFASAARRGAPR